MALDLSKVKARPRAATSLDPEEIFRRLPKKDSSINDLWLGQGDALRAWHKARDKADVAINLNTGAGKTLIGLLIAQSLTNELRGGVAYLCSSIQLVEQTVAKAGTYGIETSQLIKGELTGNAYSSGAGPLITTYQAATHGFSRFRANPPSALILDDAHAADHIIRDQFSVSVERKSAQDVFEAVCHLARPYFESVNKAITFSEIIEGYGDSILLAPSDFARNEAARISRMFLEHGIIEELLSVKFAWEHIKANVQDCAFIFTPRRLTITPPFIPAKAIPAFAHSQRRVYLSATMLAEEAFIRCFGTKVDEVIAPNTPAGECERAILIPQCSRVRYEDIDVAKEVVKNAKTLIVCPSFARAKEKWAEVAEPVASDGLTDVIQNFKSSSAPAKLLLAARYDGVDFPGDACRVMVIDDLPSGISPLERYQYETLRMNNVLRGAIATRVTQAFGRISRGMGDYGVVILTGRRLVDWILVPVNQELLPEFIQKQLSLGVQVSNECSEVTDFVDVRTRCLSRDNEWLITYQSFMDDADSVPAVSSREHAVAAAGAEVKAAMAMWRNDHKGAATALVKVLDSAFSLSPSLGGWYCFWIAHSLHRVGEHDVAREYEERGIGSNFEIPFRRDVVSKGASISPQLSSFCGLFRSVSSSALSFAIDIDGVISELTLRASVTRVEEAMRKLGLALGLNSSRPDNDEGTGPDVCWSLADGAVFVADLKTDKRVDGEYHKKETAQLTDHENWARGRFPEREIVTALIGPRLPVSKQANPSPSHLLLELEPVIGIARSLREVIRSLEDNATPIEIEVLAGKALDAADLRFDILLRQLPFSPLIY